MREEKKYTVATYSYACTAYVRTTLRRGLELQSTHKVWASTEYVNAAKEMVGKKTWEGFLPDATTWELTKLELMTIKRALSWRAGRRAFVGMDSTVSESTKQEWSQIEDEIYRVLQGIWHSEGKYWM